MPVLLCNRNFAQILHHQQLLTNRTKKSLPTKKRQQIKRGRKVSKCPSRGYQLTNSVKAPDVAKYIILVMYRAVQIYHQNNLQG